ncbi:hypothetical protein R6Q59_022999 [Mikania micrantha]
MVKLFESRLFVFSLCFLALLVGNNGSVSEIENLSFDRFSRTPWCSLNCWEMIIDGKHQFCCCRDKHWCNETFERCQERCDKRAKCHNC